MFTAEKQAGFALAALLADDRALQHVERALAPEVAEPMRALLAKLQHEQGGAAEGGRVDDHEVRPLEPTGGRLHDDKARLIARLLEQVRPALSELAPSLPARAASLLAPHLPRRPARSSGVPIAPARPGYVPPADLSALLLRLARAASASTRGATT